MDTISLTREYHKKMGIAINDDISISSAPTNKYRVKMIATQLFNLGYALEHEDRNGVLEYLSNIQKELDSAYIIFGMAQFKDKAFEAVHNADMTKLNDDGRPVISNDGEIAKTNNYQAPNMDLIMGEQEL